MSGGSKSQTQTTKTEPWKVQQPYIKTLFSEADKLRQQGPAQYFPGQTVAGLNDYDRYAQELAGNYALGQGGQAAGMAVNSLGFGLTAMDLANNPYIADYMTAATRPTYQNLSQQTLPQLTAGSVGAGGVGSSRAGIAQGLAVQGAQQTAGDIQARIAADAYAKGLDTYGRTLALAPQTIAAGFMPSQAIAGIGEFNRAYEQSLIDAAMERHNFQQQAPWAMLADYQSLISGQYGGTTKATAPAQKSGGLRGAIGGAVTGFLSTGNPWGAAAGAVIGALG